MNARRDSATPPKLPIGDCADDRAFIVHLHRTRSLAEVAESGAEEFTVVDW